MAERRRSLTPLESEIRVHAHPEASKPSWLERRRQRKRRPPTTTSGAVVRGLLRLGIAVALASGIALVVADLTGRGTSFGFYVIGAAVLGIAFLTSASPMGSRAVYLSYSRGEREQRVSWSFAYILVGAIVVMIGVLIDLL